MSKARELAELGAVYDSGALSNRNLIINGDMQIAQRGTSATLTTAGSSYDALDRFESYRNSSYAPNFTISRDTTGPDGFSRSLKVDVDATATPTGSQNFGVRTKVEGFDAAQTGLGTSGSKQITLSFYVKSNKTGTYGTQVFRNGSTAYSTTKGYTIDAANTWERKVLTFNKLTTNNTPQVGSSWGIMVHFELSSGPDDAIAPYDWAAVGAARTVTGQVNLMDNTSNYWQITGVQLEVGDTATPFEHRSFGDELARCQRYCYVIDPQSAFAQYGFIGFCESNTAVKTMRTFPVRMRSAPSFSRSGNFNYDGATANPTFSSQVGVATTVDSCRLEDTVSSGNTGQGVLLINNNDATATITFDAEL